MEVTPENFRIFVDQLAKQPARTALRFIREPQSSLERHNDLHCLLTVLWVGQALDQSLLLRNEVRFRFDLCRFLSGRFSLRCLQCSARYVTTVSRRSGYQRNHAREQ
jgi:hypothetical protein